MAAGGLRNACDCRRRSKRQQENFSGDRYGGKNRDRSRQIRTQNSGYTFRVVPADAPFGDYFLAMRPFKCIADRVQHVCHFPYRSSGQIRADDLVDLEYALMFLHKKPQEVSVDPWNGVYYKMRIVDSRIEGIVHNVDMNLVITAPFDMVRTMLTVV